ncbi:hypothetical protein SAMN05443245_7605 [Paraburkholderia fungorum]|uniref:Uncharacterized protein n=1 Tax=Paraburkholderia fungorum TaxID=134537 RepID=A0A1H1JZG0_9BURK|nr:hypothetical protein [Paraburkholderia fungorum]SDR55139.1 hypothetical protein SAMN05443245_7605 [Paraburkholderia fungorum]
MNSVEDNAPSAEDIAQQHSGLKGRLTRCAVFVISLALTGCASDPTTRSGGIGEVMVSGAATCMGLGFARICDTQNDNISKPFYEAFDSTSMDRRRVAKEIVARHASVSLSNIEILPVASPTTQRWHAKLAVVAASSVFDSSKTPYLPQDEETRSWMRHQDLPVFANVSLSPFKLQVNDSAVRQWAFRLHNDPYAADKCTFNGVPEDCATVLTPDHIHTLVTLIDKASQSSDEGQDLTGFFRRELAAQRFQKFTNNSLSTIGRDVYVVHAEGFSPQVDFLGNLYIPDTFERNWDQAEQELILDHEAAHVSAFGVDCQTFFLQQAFTYYFSSGKVDLSPLYAIMRKPDEMFVDLLAARAFHMTPQQLRESASLLDGLENASPARADGLRELASLEAKGIAINTLVGRRLQTNVTASQLPTGTDSSPRDIDTRLARYRDLTAEYQAYLAPGRVQALAGDMTIDNLAVHDYVIRALHRADSAQLSFNTSDGITWALTFTTISLKYSGDTR